jgi:hypothetical protein
MASTQNLRDNHHRKTNLPLNAREAQKTLRVCQGITLGAIVKVKRKLKSIKRTLKQED